MSEISRRDFVKTTASAVAAGVVLTTGLDVHANPLGLPIGCQTWPVRDMIAMPGLDQQLNPAFSPDGRTVVFRALRGGRADLFSYNRDTKAITTAAVSKIRLHVDALRNQVKGVEMLVTAWSQPQSIAAQC